MSRTTLAPRSRARAYAAPVSAQSRRHLLLGGVAAGLTAACGGSPTAPERDQVFYLHERGVIDKSYSWERYFPPLDRDAEPRMPRRVGVAIFEGDVRFSRPVDWFLRTADYSAEQRRVSYQSPRQFVFNVYERTDPPRATWQAILERYEADVKEAGGELISARIPTATANAQGRSYLVRTPVPGTDPPFKSTSREILVRTPNRILLVQVIHGDDIDGYIDEMAHTVKSMRVY
ncbi:MAG: hypothetical protein AAGA56_23285 [Myxococcota bacterium]